MSCTSSSRILLQPLINSRGVSAKSHGLLQLLCPRYFSSADSRQVNLSTNSTAQNLEPTSDTLPSYHAAPVAEKPGFGPNAIDHITSVHSKDKRRDNEQQDNGVARRMDEMCLKAQTPKSSDLSMLRTSDLKLRRRNRFTELQPFLLLKMDLGDYQYPGSISTTENFDIKEQKVTSSSEVAVQIRNLAAINIQKFVEEQVANKVSREWINSEFRNKTTWSSDWIQSANMLLASLYWKLKKDPKASEDNYAPKQTTTFQLIDNDFIGVPVSSIPVPSTWTRATFAQYVHDLSRSRMPPQLNKILRKKTGILHQHTVQEYLENVLFTDINSSLVSVSALESTIRFFYRFEFLPSVQRLFFYMQQQQIPYPDRCFDLVLRKTALNKDCSNFTTLLRIAVDLGFEPSGTTWASLVICLLSNEASDTIVGIMKRHDLLTDVKVKQDLAADMLNRMLSEQISNVIPVEMIFSHVDARLGADWFCLRSANIILKYLCTATSGTPISDFLKLMSTQGCNPDIDSLNILLLRYLRARDIKAAIDVVVELNTTRGVIPDVLSYKFLFELAWMKQLPNTCRIIWAAACAYRRIPQSMTKQILESLTGKEKLPMSSSRRQPRGAGYLVIGLDPRHHSPGYKFFVNTVPQQRADARLQSLGKMISILGAQVDDIDYKVANRGDAMTFVQHDQELSIKYYYPFKVFRNQLQMALEMDEVLNRKDFSGLPLESQMKQMIQPDLLLKVVTKRERFATVSNTKRVDISGR